MTEDQSQVVEASLNQGRKKRVLVVAYALSPVLGSEYRSAWELTNLISKSHDVTVLLGDSDGLMGSFKHFDEFVEGHQLPFEAVKISPSSMQIAIAKRMLRMPWALFFPVLLRSWHRKAFKIAKQLHAERNFDVVHQLGPIGFRNPGYVWQLDCHSYWGPIGGAQYVDYRMIRRRFSSYTAEVLFRNLSVRLQALSPYISKAARGFDTVSFATVENAEYFSKHFGRSGPIISDQGLFVESDDAPQPSSASTPLNVAWAGSLTARKNVDLLLDTVRRAPRDITFHVMGAGPYADQLTALAKEHRNLVFHGVVPRTEVMNILNKSDAILLTSLSEANTAILFEGMEHGCIPIAPRINGFVSTLTGEIGFLIDQGNYDISVAQTVEALRSLQNPEIRAQMFSALQKHKPMLSWDALAQAHVAQYVE